MEYSSINLKSVLAHRELVGHYLNIFNAELFRRAVIHDYSKLSDEEAPIFEEATTKLKDLTYGSEEYKEQLKAMKPALDHHYKVNPHHPEYFENGIDGMNLFDLVEMVCDWFSAVKRHDDGDIFKSLDINRERFEISEQTYNIILNTIKKIESM